MELNKTEAAMISAVMAAGVLAPSAAHAASPETPEDAITCEWVPHSEETGRAPTPYPSRDITVLEHGPEEVTVEVGHGTELYVKIRCEGVTGQKAAQEFAEEITINEKKPRVKIDFAPDDHQAPKILLRIILRKK